MTILLSLAKVLKVCFFFFFSFPITSDFEGEHGYLEQGMGTWIQNPYTVPQNERVLGDHVIDKLLKSHDCQIRKNLEICHHLQTLYPESYFFVISPLPEKESNRLFIRRKKMCNLYYNSRHCSNLQSSHWFHYYTGLQLHIPCDKSFVQFLLLSAIHSSFLRSGALVWGNQLDHLGNLQELFCLNIDSKRLLARRKTYKKYF